jgi:hypothetical protein
LAPAAQAPGFLLDSFDFFPGSHAQAPVFENSVELVKLDRRFLENLEKISEIQKKMAETQRRQQSYSENRKDRNSVGFTDKSIDFSKN